LIYPVYLFIVATLPVDEDGVRHGNLRGRSKNLLQRDLGMAGDASSHQSLKRDPRLVAPLHGREVQFTESKVGESKAIETP
jgi:hypothetical protein